MNMQMEGGLFNHAYGIMKPIQRQVFDECWEKEKCAITLGLGQGKTLISLAILVRAYELSGIPSIFICSKTLMANIINQIHKFFDRSLKYEVVQSDFVNLKTWNMNPETMLIITTPEVCMKSFKDMNIESSSIMVVREGNGYGGLSSAKNIYVLPTEPFGMIPWGYTMLHSIQWSAMIVDEAHDYSNITSKKCRSIISICSPRRILVSGTLMNEPKLDKQFGVYMMLNIGTVPNDRSAFSEFISSDSYEGMGNLCVAGDEELMTKFDVKVNIKVIEHSLTEDEARLYEVFRNIVKRITDVIDRTEDKEESKSMNSGMLSMISYIREMVICPILPFTSVFISCIEGSNVKEVAHECLKSIDDENITSYLDNEDSIISSRMRSMLSVIDQHQNEKIVIFSTFARFLSMFGHFINRQSWNISSEDSYHVRNRKINDWSNSENGIILLTYKIGGAGLNLQAGSVVILADLWWNDATTQQAIGRVVRTGQTASECNIYYFDSNTSIEKSITRKHKQKDSIISEMLHGKVTTEIETINLREIADFIIRN